MGRFSAAVSVWRQGGTRFACLPRRGLLTPNLGQDISDGIQLGREPQRARWPAPGPMVNDYGPSFNALLKYVEGDHTALRLFVSRSQLNLQRTYRQGLFMPAPGAQQPMYINERFVLDFEKRWGSTQSWGQLTFRPAILVFGHDMRSQSVAAPFYQRGRPARTSTSSTAGRDATCAWPRPWNTRSICPTLVPSSRSRWWPACSRNTTSPPTTR